MAEVLDAARLAPADRVEAIREAIWAHVAPVEISYPRGPEGIGSVTRLGTVGPVRVCSSRATPFTLRRTASLVRRDPEPAVFIAVQGAGTTIVSQGERRVVLRPGQLAVYDTTQPYLVHNDGPSLTHYFRITRASLGLPGRVLDAVVGTTIDPGATVLAEVVAPYLVRLATGSILDDPAAAAAAASPTLELMRALLRATEIEGRPSSPDREALATRALAYVDAHVRERDLTPVRIAAAHNVSVRLLYIEMARAGVSIHDTIVSRRLEGCRRQLGDPRWRHQTVAEVASHWGWVDPSHFSRRFRQEYGQTPTQWKRAALGVAPSPG